MMTNKILGKKIEDADKNMADTNSLVQKTNFNLKITKIGNKIFNTSDLVSNSNFNSKNIKMKYKIPTTSNSENVL